MDDGCFLLLFLGFPTLWLGYLVWAFMNGVEL